MARVLMSEKLKMREIIAYLKSVRRKAEMKVLCAGGDTDKTIVKLLGLSGDILESWMKDEEGVCCVGTSGRLGTRGLSVC